MAELSRRTFIWKGSLAAGAVAAAPAFPVLLAGAGPAASTAEDVAPDLPDGLPEGASVAEPLIAHVRDLATGEIEIFLGNQQVVYRNAALAAQLYRAAR